MRQASPKKKNADFMLLLDGLLNELLIHMMNCSEMKGKRLVAEYRKDGLEEFMQIFLNQLQSAFPDEIIVLVCDGTAWRKSGTLKVPDQITILHIPPYTPVMNPIEQIWHELRTKGFHNEVFSTLEKVVDRLCETINHPSNDTVMSITQRDWIRSVFI